MDLVTQALQIGIVATIGMDVWAAIVKYIFRLPTTDWAMIGRWFAHMPRVFLFIIRSQKHRRSVMN